MGVFCRHKKLILKIVNDNRFKACVHLIHYLPHSSKIVTIWLAVCKCKGIIMTNIKSCKVKLLNKSYEIKCPEGEEINLLLAAEKINEKMQQNKSKFKQLDNFQTLLLAALDIGHELIICKNEQEHQRHQVTQFISSLENKINKVVGGETDTLTQTD